MRRNPEPPPTPVSFGAPPEPQRKMYGVKERKVPYGERVARTVMPDRESVADRDFVDVFGADCPEDDGDFPIGSTVLYGLWMTEEEADVFDQADHTIYVEEQPLHLRDDQDETPLDIPGTKDRAMASVIPLNPGEQA